MPLRTKRNGQRTCPSAMPIAVPKSVIIRPAAKAEFKFHRMSKHEIAEIRAMIAERAALIVEDRRH